MSDTLYVTDMDGTLLNADGVLSAFSKVALQRLIAVGVRVTVATSRSYTALDALQELVLPVPMILLGGARLYDGAGKRVLRETTLPREEAVFAVKTLKNAGLSPLLYTQSKSDEQKIYYTSDADKELLTYVQKQNSAGDERFVLREQYPFGEKLFFVTARGKPEKLFSLLPVFAKRPVHAYLYDAVRLQGARTIEITPISKEAGLNALRDITGAKHIVAFGDNGNDSGLFAAADEKIAVQNATEALKRMADRVIGSNEEDAVVKEIARREGINIH